MCDVVHEWAKVTCVLSVVSRNVVGLTLRIHACSYESSHRYIPKMNINPFPKLQLSGLSVSFIQPNSEIGRCSCRPTCPLGSKSNRRLFDIISNSFAYFRYEFPRYSRFNSRCHKWSNYLRDRMKSGEKISKIFMSYMCVGRMFETLLTVSLWWMVALKLEGFKRHYSYLTGKLIIVRGRVRKLHFRSVQ